MGRLEWRLMKTASEHRDDVGDGREMFPFDIASSTRSGEGIVAIPAQDRAERGIVYLLFTVPGGPRPTTGDVGMSAASPMERGITEIWAILRRDVVIIE
jgi:hypothetical protein